MPARPSPLLTTTRISSNSHSQCLTDAAQLIRMSKCTSANFSGNSSLVVFTSGERQNKPQDSPETQVVEVS